MAVRRSSAISLAVCAGLLLSAGAAYWIFSTLHSASASLAVATDTVVRDGQFEAKIVPLDHAAPTAFVAMDSAARFTDAARLNDHLFIASSTSLIGLAQNGAPVAEYRVGTELPPAPLVALAAGTGPSGPELWIATRGEGFLRFDGHHFEQIRATKPSARRITGLLPLRTGRILIGTTDDGVLTWDGKSLSRFHSSLDHLHVTALEGTDTDLWVGTLDRGVIHFHAGETTTFNDANGLPDNRVLSLASSASATYAGTALGVTELKQDRVERTLLKGVFAQTLLVSGDLLLAGTLEEGVQQTALTPEQRRPRSSRLPSDVPNIARLLEIDGELYALAANGLYRQNRKVFAGTSGSLTDSNISALAVDGADRLWVGYFDRGLDILDPARENPVHYEDDALFCVNRIVHDPSRSVTAVATANGLQLFDSAAQRKRLLTKAEGLISNDVTDVLLHPTSNGLGLVVATPAGLTLIDDGGATSLYAFHGLVNNHAYALAGNGSKILIGTLGGLSVLDVGLIRASYTTANSGLKQNWITAIQRVGGSWFIGTYGAGIVEWDAAGQWSTFPDLRGQIEINMNAMAVSTRAVYAGTLDRGLAVFNRSSGRWTFLANGLPSTNVTAVTVANDVLYVGTANGLVRMPERQVPGL